MPHVKKKALDREVLLSDGSRITLSKLWEKKTIVLVFLRHFG